MREPLSFPLHGGGGCPSAEALKAGKLKKHRKALLFPVSLRVQSSSSFHLVPAAPPILFFCFWSESFSLCLSIVFLFHASSICLFSTLLLGLSLSTVVIKLFFFLYVFLLCFFFQEKCFWGKRGLCLCKDRIIKFVLCFLHILWVCLSLSLSSVIFTIWGRTTLPQIWLVGFVTRTQVSLPHWSLAALHRRPSSAPRLVAKLRLHAPQWQPRFKCALGTVGGICSWPSIAFLRSKPLVHTFIQKYLRLSRGWGRGRGAFRNTPRFRGWSPLVSTGVMNCDQWFCEGSVHIIVFAWQTLYTSDFEKFNFGKKKKKKKLIYWEYFV